MLVGGNFCPPGVKFLGPLTAVGAGLSFMIRFSRSTGLALPVAVGPTLEMWTRFEDFSPHFLRNIKQLG